MSACVVCTNLQFQISNFPGASFSLRTMYIVQPPNQQKTVYLFYKDKNYASFRKQNSQGASVCRTVFLCPQLSATQTKCWYIFRKKEHAACVYAWRSCPACGYYHHKSNCIWNGLFFDGVFLSRLLFYIVFISFGYKYVYGTHTHRCLL